MAEWKARRNSSDFTAYAAKPYPVRWIAGRLLTLSRSLLLNRTETVRFEDA